jgi:hypothetical protein
MTKQILGVTINSKKELNSALIKEEIGHIPNTEIDLLNTEFITEESLESGNKISFSLFAKMDKEIQRISNPA